MAVILDGKATSAQVRGEMQGITGLILTHIKL